MNLPVNHQLRGIFFDLDGTLIDSAPDLASALKLTFEALNRKPHSEQQVRQWVGNGVEILLHRALTNSMDGTADENIMENARDIFFKEYKNNIGRYSKLYKGVEETLNKLLNKHFLLACITNKNRAFTIPLLEKLEVKKYFNTIVCGDDVKHKKPAAEHLLAATRQLGLSVNQCLMIGDSKTDITAANNAKMNIICVDYGYNQGVNLRSLNIHSLISDFREIPPLLTDFNLKTAGSVLPAT